MKVHNLLVTGSLTSGGENIGSISSSVATTNNAQDGRLSSLETISVSIMSKTGSFSTTGSNAFNGNQTITGSLIVTSFIEAQELRTTYISSSILYRSGSTKFGDELTDSHTFTGSLLLSGSMSSTNNITISNSYRPYFIANTTNSGEEAGIKIQQSTVSDWYIGTAQGTSSPQDLAIRDVKNSRIPFYLSISTGAATFSNIITANGEVKSINGGVDGTFSDAFVGVYSSNNNEQNAIQTSVSSVAESSGFRFQASNGGGSTGRTNIVDFRRDRALFYTNVGVGTTTPNVKLEVLDTSTSSGEISRFQRNIDQINEYAYVRVGNNSYPAYFGSMLGTYDIAYMSMSPNPSDGKALCIRTTDGNVGIGVLNPSKKLEVNGKIGSPAIVSNSIIAGNIYTNISTSPSYILLCDLNNAAGFSLSGKVNAASYTCWNISDIWIYKNYSSTNGSGGISGQYKSGCDFSIVDINYGSDRFIALRFTSNPEINVMFTGYRLSSLFASDGTATVVTSGVSINTTYASY